MTWLANISFGVVLGSLASLLLVLLQDSYKGQPLPYRLPQLTINETLKQPVEDPVGRSVEVRTAAAPQIDALRAQIDALLAERADLDKRVQEAHNERVAARRAEIQILLSQLATTSATGISVDFSSPKAVIDAGREIWVASDGNLSARGMGCASFRCPEPPPPADFNPQLYALKRLQSQSGAACPHKRPDVFLTVMDLAKLARLSVDERRVVSFSLHSASPAALRGAYRNLELLPAVYPGWRFRLYYDADLLPHGHASYLAAMGADVVPMGLDSSVLPAEAENARLNWRLLVADDPAVDRYLIRDVEARVTAREALAVRDWILSGKPYHVMRDHPAHSKVPIVGGLWGGMRSTKVHIASLFKNPGAERDHASFLRHLLYPLIQPDVFGHDSYSCAACIDNPLCKFTWDDSIRFPAVRNGYTHVGQRFDEFEEPLVEDGEGIINSPPPIECSPCFLWKGESEREQAPPPPIAVNVEERRQEALDTAAQRGQVLDVTDLGAGAPGGVAWTPEPR